MIKNLKITSSVIEREKLDSQLNDLKETIIFVKNVYKFFERNSKLNKKALIIPHGRKGLKIHKGNNDMHEKEIGVIFVAAFYVRKMEPEEELQHQKVLL